MKTAQPQPRSGERVSLPAPARAGRVSLEEALSRRRSVREFAAKPLPEASLSQLLWAAQGITHPDGLRTAPSAGALYPLEVYVATATGFYHYNPQRHELERRSSSDLRPALARAALEQESIRQAGSVIVFAAVVERTALRVHRSRACRAERPPTGNSPGARRGAGGRLLRCRGAARAFSAEGRGTGVSGPRWLSKVGNGKDQQSRFLGPTKRRPSE